MPVVKCPHSGCKHNSSNIVGKGGLCQYNGTVELVQAGGADDYLDCKQFEARPLSEMQSEVA